MSREALDLMEKEMACTPKLSVKLVQMTLKLEE